MKKRIISFILAMMMLAGTILATGTSAEEAFYPDAADHWAKEHIAYVSDKGMMNGIGDGLFGPDDMVSRAMVVTVLHRLAGEPTPARESKFPDLREDWYKDAVAWGAAKGIVKGYDDGTFGPDNDVSRQELVTFIGRYAELNYVIINGEEPVGFVDAGEVESWALEYFKWAVSTKLVNGVTDDTLQPTAGATRAQFATIMHRYDTNIEAFEYELKYNEPTMYSQYTEKEYPLRDDADFFVSTTGDDSNDGKTKETAFKTFERARDAVREFKKTATDEIVVAFMAGNYGYLDNITFTAEDAGTEEVPITYCKYGDGEVKFDNGITIKSEEFEPVTEAEHYLFEDNKKFTKIIGDIYKVDISDRIDKVEQYTVMFSGSQICWEARYPNKLYDGNDDYFGDMTTRVDQFSSIEIQSRAKKVVDAFRTTEGMKVTGLLRSGWLTDTFLVESYDPETGILVFDFDNPDFDNFGNFPMTKWTEEEIANGTAPGFNQDHYDHGDRGDGVLMYEERYDDRVYFSNLSCQLDDEGEYWIDPETLTLYVYKPDGDYAIAKGGRFLSVQTGADHISFVGLGFSGASGSSETAIACSADYITFDQCTIINNAVRYLMMVGGVNNFTLSNSEIGKFGTRGIHLTGDGDQTMLQSSNNKIYNNYFHNFGYIGLADPAIWMNDCGALISHNVFENGAYSGIQFGGTCNIIEYNVFDNVTSNSTDIGCVYMGSGSMNRGNEIRYNLFKNIRNIGVYLDIMNCGQLVQGNVFYSVTNSIAKNGGRDHEIYDNVFIKSGGISESAFLYNLYAENRVEDFKPGASEYENLMNFPKEGERGYEIWREKFPILYKYHTDISKIGEPECVFSNTNYYRNNATFGSKIFSDYDPESYFAICGVFENNKDYSIDENPLFVNPTIGDYRIREDADFADIPFEEMGRE